MRTSGKCARSMFPFLSIWRRCSPMAKLNALLCGPRGLWLTVAGRAKSTNLGLPLDISFLSSLLCTFFLSLHFENFTDYVHNPSHEFQDKIGSVSNDCNS